MHRARDQRHTPTDPIQRQHVRNNKEEKKVANRREMPQRRPPYTSSGQCAHAEALSPSLPTCHLVVAVGLYTVSFQRPLAYQGTSHRSSLVVASKRIGWGGPFVPRFHLNAVSETESVQTRFSGEASFRGLHTPLRTFLPKS